MQYLTDTQLCYKVKGKCKIANFAFIDIDLKVKYLGTYLHMRIIHSRPFCELKHFPYNIKSSGNLPHKEKNIQCIQRNVKISGCFTAFLHRWY